MQAPLLGSVFLAGAWAKWTMDSTKVQHTALAEILATRKLGTAVALRSFRVVAAIELLAGVALLIPTIGVWRGILATSLTVSFVAFLLTARKLAPTKSCGCLGTEVVPDARSILRATLLVVASLGIIVAARPWTEALAAGPDLGLIVLFLEVSLLAALSPELTSYRRHTDGAFQTDNDCATVREPVEETLMRLATSRAYRDLRVHIAISSPDHWREGCWRYVTYPALFRGRLATLVFAVPVGSNQADVRAALVDDTEATVLTRV